jgi:citrate lyase subunit beta/citryl-CoA lyase
MVALISLFVPGDRPERFAKAAGSGADAVIIDLEDAVGGSAKEQARTALRKPGSLPDKIEVFIRVNAVGSLWHEADIGALAGLQIAGIVLPKSETAGQVEALHRRTNLPVLPLIETARGLAACREIASAGGVARLAFGSIDYAADLGMAHIREALLLARLEIVLASRLAGLPGPIDGVTTAINDDTVIMDDARYASALGFGGKLCIHPKQIAPALRGFAPTEAEIAWAKLIVDAPEDGAVLVGGTMVDAPVRLRARHILNRARAVSDIVHSVI